MKNIIIFGVLFVVLNILDAIPALAISKITDFPTTMPPTAHTHTISNITNLQETINLLKQEVEDAFDELATLMEGV